MKLHLPDVMLCAVSGIALDSTIDAIERSMAHVDFGDALLLSPIRPDLRGLPGLRHEFSGALDSRDEYSRFILHRLADHVTCRHVLLVQWDGFVVDPTAWSNQFAEFDYVGATWPQFSDGMIVGNGGFSLRSKELLRRTAMLPLPEHPIEDVLICREWRPALERHGLRFAPPELADRFSFERASRGGPTFGFHGLFNFPAVFSQSELVAVLEGLPPPLLSGLDGLDLIDILMRGHQRQLAWSLARRRPTRSWLTRKSARRLCQLISGVRSRNVSTG